MMAQKLKRKNADAQKTDISVSADGYFGEMKKTETPSKSRRVGRYVINIVEREYIFTICTVPVIIIVTFTVKLFY